MGNKYLDSKKGSLEQSILDIWNEAATKTEKDEELTAKQKKIDLDKDGDIGADDLAKLRKKGKKEDKEEVAEGELPPALKKAIDAKKKKEGEATAESWMEAIKKVEGWKPGDKKEKKEEKDKKESTTVTGKKPADVELNPKDEEGKKK